MEQISRKDVSNLMINIVIRDKIYHMNEMKPLKRFIKASGETKMTFMG